MSEIDLVALLRETVPKGGWTAPEVAPPAPRLTDLYEWRHPGAEWATIEARARGNDEGSRAASNTRVWNPQHNLIGAFAEWAYGSASGLPWNTSPDLGDGGEDFPGIDVKGTEHWRSPRLLRLATDPLKAPCFVLVAVDLVEVRARYVGWATRQQLVDAPHEEYGHGPTRTLFARDLREGLPE